MVKLGTHFDQDFLADHGLYDVDDVFQKTGKGNGPDIQTAVEKKQLFITKVYCLVDDALLHFQGKDAEEQAADNNEQQQKLQGSMAPGYPVK